METPPAEATKAELRAWARTRRAALDLPALSETLAARCAAQPEFAAAQRILLYLALPGEIDAEALTRRPEAAEKSWFAPRCAEDRRLAVHAYTPNVTPLQIGPFGLREPDPAHVPEADPQQIDLIIVPALLVSEAFARLGYGGGWYDRFLPRLRPDAVKLSLLPDALVLPSLPTEPWDVPLDIIVTDSRALRRRQPLIPYVGDSPT